MPDQQSSTETKNITSVDLGLGKGELGTSFIDELITFSETDTDEYVLKRRKDSGRLELVVAGKIEKIRSYVRPTFAERLRKSWVVIIFLLLITYILFIPFEKLLNVLKRIKELF